MAFVYPNFQNSREHTLMQGARFIPTRFRVAGTSLHPLQRTGDVSSTTFPVDAPRGTRQLGGNMRAGDSMQFNPPIVAFAGTSHTRMPGYMV